MDNEIKKLIEKAISESITDFQRKPFDYLLSEREAQSLVFDKLRKVFSEPKYESSIYINNPTFEYKGPIASVRLELPIDDGKWKPDIVILTKDPQLTYQTKYEFADIKSAIQAIIEIKVAWGIDSVILRGLQEDINKVKNISAISGGYALLFWGNEYSLFNEEQAKWIQTFLQKELHKLGDHNVRIIFRDMVFPST